MYISNILGVLLHFIVLLVVNLGHSIPATCTSNDVDDQTSISDKCKDISYVYLHNLSLYTYL